MPPRGPKARVIPPPRKGAYHPSAVVGTPDADDQRAPVFSFLHADREHDGAWSWPTDAEAGEILRFMCEMSRLTWAEIMGRQPGGGKVLHHEQSIDSVCQEAQDRITALGHDERFESLFRFAIGSRKRLWGFVTAGVFYLLWWDRDHQVYPVGTD